MNRFDHDSTNTSRDAAIAAGDGQNWSRGSSWRMSGLGGSSGGRSLRNTWGSSAVGGAGPAAGSVVAAAVRDGARLREWRTEADADLSDIKATMQRIDGGDEKEWSPLRHALLFLCHFFGGDFMGEGTGAGS